VQQLRRVPVLGVGFDPITQEEAITAVVGLVEGGGVHQVVTAGAELVMMAGRQPALSAILERAALVVPDGAGVVWASRRLHPPGLPARVPGVDLAAQLLGLAEARGWPVFLLGARPWVLDALVTRLRKTHPGLTIAGARHGYFEPEQERAMARRIARQRPRLLLVALGQPRQERFIAAYQDHWKDVVAIGVGGSFDVLAGVVPRAPAWMQRRGLEWLYRLFRDPKRWRRQLALPAFALAVLRRHLLRG
jgi:N-acetylglucosaminyldiphosphoundecaprenol N-acetyl-beta-D-mannosaminyltransferase